jgi:hypothetical protein
MIKKFEKLYDLREYATDSDGSHSELTDSGIIEDVKNACIDRYGYKIRIRISTIR